MAPEDDDLLGAEALGGNHAAKANRPVADDGHRLPGTDLGDYGRVLAGAHHVGEGQQGGQPGVVLRHRERNECPVGLGNAKRLGLGPADLASTKEATVDAGRVETLVTKDAASRRMRMLGYSALRASRTTG